MTGPHADTAVGLAVALVVIAGAHATTNAYGRSAPEGPLAPASSRYVMPSKHAAGELDRTVRALYGPRRGG